MSCQMAFRAVQMTMLCAKWPVLNKQGGTPPGNLALRELK